MDLTETKYAIADIGRYASTSWVRTQWHRRERRASKLTIAQAMDKAARDAAPKYFLPTVGNYVNRQFV